MENSKDGGPAFPNEGFNGWGDPQAGMTLRDYFAAKAMQTLLIGAVLPTKEDRAQWLPMLSGVAYEMADAMLHAREAA